MLPALFSPTEMAGITAEFETAIQTVGGTRRRKFTMNCIRHCHTEDDLVMGRNYVRVHSPGGYNVVRGPECSFLSCSTPLMPGVESTRINPPNPTISSSYTSSVPSNPICLRL